MLIDSKKFIKAVSAVKFYQVLSKGILNLNLVATFSCDISQITIYFSDCCYFSDINISQDSVATCGGMVGHFTTTI